MKGGINLIIQKVYKINVKSFKNNKNKIKSLPPISMNIEISPLKWRQFFRFFQFIQQTHGQ